MTRLAAPALAPAVAVALVVATLLGLRVGVVETVRVDGISMSPTLHSGDLVVVDKLDREPARGDLVVFASPEDGSRTIKRVVGAAGDVVAIRDAVLSVNDVVVDEPYVDHASIDALYYGPVRVPDRAVLVLGDRRAGSTDSRQYGPVPLDSIIGTVRLRWWPVRR